MKIRSAEFVTSATAVSGYAEAELPEVAFAGRSNVGKSSLMNSLMQRKSLVKVSGKPGHTRLLNWFKVNDEIMLCDLPGYGFANVPVREQEKWRYMIETYLLNRESLLALCVLIDVRRGVQDDDMMLVQSAAQMGLQPILVATKCDKLKRNKLMNQKNKIARDSKLDIKRDIIWYSSETHAGREQLWKRILDLTPVQVQAPEATETE